MPVRGQPLKERLLQDSQASDWLIKQWQEGQSLPSGPAEAETDRSGGRQSGVLSFVITDDSCRSEWLREKHKWKAAAQPTTLRLTNNETVTRRKQR